VSVRITPQEFAKADGTADWRVVGDGACAYFRAASFSQAARCVAAIADLAGIDGHSPDVDLRGDGVTVRLYTAAEDYYGMTRQDAELARRISALAAEHGLSPDPTSVQSVLIVPGAPDVPAVVPFWRAVLGYEPRVDSPDEDLVDPRGRWPGLWFESMDEPRQGGGAVHIAVWVPPEQAEARVAAALASGGRMVRDADAPSSWTLADSAGNEADVATISGRH
jgi:4a-hydroxytetrahydrobiopterin dehydratase